VNGKKGRAVDFDAPEVDITELLHTGSNEIRVEVSSSLNNRLLARGYFDQVPVISKKVHDAASNGMEDEMPIETFRKQFSITARVENYGLGGGTRLELFA
jgi:hypothetical protein